MIDSATEAQLVENEHRIMTALGRGDVATLRSLLAVDVCFLTGDVGIVPAAALFDVFSRLRVINYRISQPRVLSAGRNSAVVSYELEQHGTLGDQPFSSHTYSTSVWVQRDGHWQVIFHQETPVQNDSSSRT